MEEAHGYLNIDIEKKEAAISQLMITVIFMLFLKSDQTIKDIFCISYK